MKPQWAPLALAALSIGLASGAVDAQSRDPPRSGHSRRAAASACEGARAPLPDTVLVHLAHGAFPGAASPDVAVHIPKGFDATRRPGLILYFHGWQGCVAASLAAVDVRCDAAGPLHSAANLARQVDEAHVNALLVAVELRVDASTGEPGRLAMPGGARELLHELFVDHLAKPLGCALLVDALDRIVIVAHSGGYQAAAGVIARGDLPQVTEVDLLDALYGAPDVFTQWIADDITRFNVGPEAGLRFVDLYTCCGGTYEPSRAMAMATKRALFDAGLANAVYDDDGDRELDEAMLERSIVFKRVARAHTDLPRAYLRTLFEAAGFARVSSFP